MHQAIEHLDDVETCPERRIHRPHFEADDAAADDQHALRPLAQLQRTGARHHARIVLRQERQLHRFRTGGNDGALETDRPCTAHGERDSEVKRVDELTRALNHRDLAHLGHCRQATGQLAHDLFLVRPELGQVDPGLGERDAERFEVPHFVHHGGHVQQRFRRDAADVQAHASERCVAFHQHRLQAQIRGPKGRRIAARAGAEYEHVALQVGAADDAGCRRCSRRGFRRRHNRRGCRRGGGGYDRGSRGGGRFNRHDDRAFIDLVAQFDFDLLHHAAVRRRDLHRGLVAFDRDETLLGLHGVARLDEQLDDGHVLEIADVRNLDVDERHGFQTFNLMV